MPSNRSRAAHAQGHKASRARATKCSGVNIDIGGYAYALSLPRQSRAIRTLPHMHLRGRIGNSKKPTGYWGLPASAPSNSGSQELRLCDHDVPKFDTAKVDLLDVGVHRGYSAQATVQAIIVHGFGIDYSHAMGLPDSKPRLSTRNGACPPQWLPVLLAVVGMPPSPQSPSPGRALSEESGSWNSPPSSLPPPSLPPLPSPLPLRPRTAYRSRVCHRRLPGT